ncbi:hypothetical protein [Thalassotalea litorea]|uniref:hypothetical protein n=1 Tax=Thalassotalea litorea TaxID=2020715 RepID=UPI0037370EC9
MQRIHIPSLHRLIFLSILLVSLPAAATALKYRSLSELASAADAVLQGKVEDIQSRRLANGTIVTFVTLNNLILHRGEYTSATFTLVTHGGEVNGLVQKIQGAPDFKLSQQLILFLQGNGERMVPISGWGQGMFVINNGKVYDYQLNPVLDIQDDHIRVDRLSVPDVVLVGAPTPPTASLKTTVMTEAQFIQSILRTPKKNASRPLRSVESSSFTLPRHNTSEALVKQQ